MRIRLTTSRIKTVDVIIEPVESLKIEQEVVQIGKIEVQLLSDGKVFNSHGFGFVLQNSRSELWVQLCTPNENPPAYLAANVDNLIEIARRWDAASQTACLPRSQQFRNKEAVAQLEDWLRQNDPNCLEPSSFWEDLQSDGT